MVVSSKETGRGHRFRAGTHHNPMSDARESARTSGNRVMPRSRQDRVAMTGTKKVMRRNTLGSLELMKIQGGMTVVMPIRPRIWMRI